jgi:hypothetical protein
MERSKIMTADELLISAKGLHWQKPFVLANRGSLSDSAISHRLKRKFPGENLVADWLCLPHQHNFARWRFQYLLAESVGHSRKLRRTSKIKPA